MSVSIQLGFTPGGPAPISADVWHSWCARHPELQRFAGVQELREWVRAAPRDESDDVLWCLAELAAHDGGNDLDAARWLAWMHLGGVARLGGQLDRIEGDQLAASSLWIEVRSFPWRTRRNVAANIIAGVRARVLAEMGCSRDRRHVRRRLVLVPDLVAVEDSMSALQVGDFADNDDPRSDLMNLLDWACGEQVIESSDRALLLCLVETMRALPEQKNHIRGGLMSLGLTQEVGRRVGASGRTVRRHVDASLKALAAAADRYQKSA